ncbi:MAG: chlorophyll synthase ChlG [Rhodospirillaceae bacterium]|nr:chlorophyll synthase ChlG [Rhodospirillaceae bacterium]
MADVSLADSSRSAPTPTWPAPRAVLELFKPVTWFPPMWAFMCGVVSSGAAWSDTWWLALAGVMLAGPLVCATSQAVNDWFDRDLDAINEPHRPIPSGRIPGRWGLWIALLWTWLSVLYASFLGPWVFAATLVGLALAWAYSAPPVRLKQSGWWGPGAVALSYEGITWFTGAAVVLGTLPDWRIIALAALYSFGAHGIMTLNDFKAIEGDRKMGIRSLPAELGPDPASWLACVVMAAPQVVVISLLVSWDRPWFAAGVGVLLAAQLLFMARLVRDPRALAPWYNGTGVLSYVLGMLVSAIAVRGLAGGV